MTGFMAPPSLDIASEAVRELSVRLLGLSQVSRLLETLPRLEQIGRQIRLPHVDAKALDQARALDDGAPWFPESAFLARAELHSAFSDEAERAGLGFPLAHVSSVRSPLPGSIRRGTDSDAAFYGAAFSAARALRVAVQTPTRRVRLDSAFCRSGVRVRPRCSLDYNRADSEAMPSEEFGTGDPLFTVDRELVVLSWNQAVENLTGILADDAIGRRCWDLLGGLGERGDVICHAGCSNARLAREGFPLPCRQLLVRTAHGRILTAVSTVALGDGRLLHVLVPRGRQRRARIDLTRREREVLALIAEGFGTKAITSHLGLAETTVRTYIRAILRELGAHSQLEAVAKARRAGLI
jgi:DNA-binding CsgD family transcriptional regulator